MACIIDQWSEREWDGEGAVCFRNRFACVQEIHDVRRQSQTCSGYVDFCIVYCDDVVSNLYIDRVSSRLGDSWIRPFKYRIPREEIEAVWSILRLCSCCANSNQSASDFKQPQQLLAGLIFYDCGTLPTTDPSCNLILAQLRWNGYPFSCRLGFLEIYHPWTHFWSR